MITVMIADDESIECEHLVFQFQQVPNTYRVIAQATNSLETIELAARLRPDILILDVSMPILNGLEVAKQIRLRIPDQIIILNSAYANFEYARSAIDCGIDGYILKPASQETLFNTISNCIGKRYARLPDIRFDENEYPFDLSDQMLRHLEEGSVSSFFQRASQMLENMERNIHSFYVFKMYVIHTLLNVERVTVRVAGDTTTPIPENFSNMLTMIGNAQFRQDVLSQAVELVCQIADAIGQKKDSADVIEQVRNYIDQNLTQELTLEHLSQQIHFSKSHLSRLFLKRTQMTVQQYIRQKRVDFAVQLLKTSSQSIDEIAQSCGFQNISHFYRTIKANTGLTPSQIRLNQGSRPGGFHEI